MDSADKNIEIVPFEDKHAKAFKKLNLEWLGKYDPLKPMDLEYLNNPQQAIIDRGGKVLMVINNGVVVGTCAIIKKTAHTAEFSKLSVLPSIRKKGIGSLLIIASINLTQKMGFKKVVIVLNKKLDTAIQLYQSLGFKPRPVPEDLIYESTDIYMELNIS
ncbi:MAG: GNAT family N-acetyltransferase [Desulfobacteraceae bacterium]|nr:GNAT family N-acetyltransferase [Desulfobacteraceae bacterium]